MNENVKKIGIGIALIIMALITIAVGVFNVIGIVIGLSIIILLIRALISIFCKCAGIQRK